jgi:hypothetical protein
MKRSGAAWLEHLQDMARVRVYGSNAWLGGYSTEEIKEITTMINVGEPGKSTRALSHVLERREGTQRFGHALRQLGRHNAVALRDVYDELSIVRTQDELVEVLCRAVQQCVALSDRSNFIIVPTEEDLKLVLDDVDAHGARAIAGLLNILSVLRYSATGGAERSEEKDQDALDALLGSEYEDAEEWEGREGGKDDR